MIEPAAALAHWAKWAIDTGSWRQSCVSIEHRCMDDPARYVFEEDAEKRFRFRYDQRTGELVEKLVTTMPTAERQALQARHVYYPALTDEAVARRLGMSARGFDTVLLAATLRFGRLWRESHRVAA
ncbi:hypothetical protein LH425_06540 [Laribacter hongkongensis]|uniref:hypothetical protein n=1 Tax=Laribacter hongkongensis TaxID=168471 RepID=UPI001EFC9034|nr:hypothetical protein [Laribacter hongkongensis]MCG9064701.1 hypothetical protein [Laribacter hongkongensis]